MKNRVSDIIAGLVVIVAAGVFLAYAASRTRSVGGSGYELHAQFGSIGPLAVGAPVKIAGVSVGQVTATTLDPKTYAAIVRFSIQPDVKIPKDSSAAIESASLLGSDYLSINPGGSDTMLKPGQAIVATQSAINIESLLGKFIFSAANLASSTSKSGGGNGGSGGQGNASGSSGLLPK